MNILLVVRWPVGGIRTYIRDMYSRLARRGWRVSILTIDIPEARVLQEELGDAISAWHFVSAAPGVAEFIVSIKKALKDGEVALVHAHGFTSGFLALLSTFFTKVPVLLTSHDVLLETQFAGFKGRLKRRLLALLFSRFAGIHLISNDARENLLQMFPAAARWRTWVILNGIDGERLMRAERRDLHAQLKLSRDTLLIGFLGRFMAPKGFRFLVDAVARIEASGGLGRPFQVLCVGGGGFVREEQEALKQKGLDGHFVFMPFERDVAGLLKGLDVVVMPSRWETCPLLPMEALVCGTPLIASNCVGLREVVADTPSLTVPVADANAIAVALREVSESTRTPFTAYASTAVSRYDIEAAVDGVDGCYRDIIRAAGKVV